MGLFTKRRRTKGLLATLLSGQKKTQRKNKPRAPMCAPGGSRKRKKSWL